MEDNLANEPTGSPIIFAGPFFAQTPIELLRDTDVPPAAKTLYAIYHAHCREKHLANEPFSFVNQRRLADDWMGCSQQHISKLTRVLNEKGWLTTIRQGQGRPNIIVLHGNKQKRISERQEMDYRRQVLGRYKERDEART